VLDAAVEEGCTFWDTADLYGSSEELLGKWSVLHRFMSTLLSDSLLLLAGLIGQAREIKSSSQPNLVLFLENLGKSMLDRNM